MTRLGAIIDPCTIAAGVFLLTLKRALCNKMAKSTYAGTSQGK